MFGGFLLALATLWAVVVTDVVVESARRGGGELVGFGHRFASPGLPAGIWILAGLAASAAFAVAIALGLVRARRLERRVRVDLNEQWTEGAHRQAGDEGRSRLLAWRLAEVQTQVAELTERRDALRAEGAREEVREDRLTSVGLHRRPEQPVVVPEGDREVVLPEANREQEPVAPSAEG